MATHTHIGHFTHDRRDKMPWPGCPAWLSSRLLDLAHHRDSQPYASLVHFVFPNSVIVHRPDYVSHVGIFPAAVDQSLFVHTVLTPERPCSEKAQAHWERSFELIDGKVFNDEDLFICEQIQLGLAAAAGVDFVLGRFEHNVRRFHANVAAALNSA